MHLEWPATVAHRIDEMIAQYPNSIALKDGYGRILTYTEMDKRVNSISGALRVQLPANNEQAVIGVFQMPSADWICSLVAINRIGAIYLPLDLRNSIPRLRSNVEATRPAAILSDNETVSQIKQIDPNEDAIVINVSEYECFLISYSVLLCRLLSIRIKLNINYLLSRFLTLLPPRRRKKKHQQNMIALPT